jgi:DNA-binding beta-propeller fold protein YncE
MAPWLGVLAVAAVTMAACGGGGRNPGGLERIPREQVTPVEGSSLGGFNPAPEFPGGHTWFNVREPLTLASLKGKAVLLDFWTLGCINCQHIIPDELRLEREFGDALVIIGVHSGKYDREHEDESIREAIVRYGLEHPVLNDADFVIWSMYGVRAWPTLVLIDPAGNLVGMYAGEGIYSVFQPTIASLIDEFGARGEIDHSPIPLDLEAEGVTSAVLSYPSAVLADEASDRLFIADAGHNRVLIAGLDGALQDIIGSSQEGLDDGAFDEATFRQPQGLALSPDGTILYIADTRNHAIRMADLAIREVYTIAGTGRRALTLPVNSDAREADLASPWGLVVHEETLYIAMAGVHQIWAMALGQNMISVFAGSGREGIDDGPRLAATLAQPSGLTTDGSSLLWADPESSSVRKVLLAGEGVIETIVGLGLFDFGDADGVGTEALLEHPQGIIYVNDTIYVADTYNHKVRAIDPTSLRVHTVAGGPEAGLNDGAGSEAQLDEPSGLSAAHNILHIADTNNHAVRLLNLRTGVVSTLALSNLSAAVQRVSSRTLKVGFSGQTIAPHGSILRMRFAAPAGYHLNGLATSELALASSNPTIVELGEETASFSTGEPSVEVVVPVHLRNGDAVITIQGQVYYCSEGGGAVCLITHLDMVLPVTVAPDASQTEIDLAYDLPEAPQRLRQER